MEPTKEELQQAIDDGLKVSEIAKKLGLSLKATQKKLKKLGVVSSQKKMSLYLKENSPKIINLALAGVTPVEIARKMGCSKNPILVLLRKNGISPKKLRAERVKRLYFDKERYLGYGFYKCEVCKEYKSRDLFSEYKNSSHKNGINNSCKVCEAISGDSRRAENKREWVKFLGGKCMQCGEVNHILLEFHHREPKEKSYSLSSRTNCKLDTVKEELKKCDLLCTKCHRKTHMDISNKKREEFILLANSYKRTTSRRSYDSNDPSDRIKSIDKSLRLRKKVLNYIAAHNNSKVHCEFCGESNPLYLDTHHKNPAEKEFAIHKSFAWNEKLKSELEKCMLLCCFCHKKLHHNLRLEARNKRLAEEVRVLIDDFRVGDWENNPQDSNCDFSISARDGKLLTEGVGIPLQDIFDLVKTYKLSTRLTIRDSQIHNKAETDKETDNLCQNAVILPRKTDT